MRKLTILGIKFLLSAGLLYLALSKVDFPGLWARLNAQSLKWLILSMAALLLQLFVGGLRWREISNHCGAPMSVRQTTRFTVIGAFFNQTLPSSIGGDAVRLLLLSRAGAGWRAAAYSVFVDRAVGLIALAIIVVLSLPWSYQLIADPHGRITLTLIDLLALGAGSGFLAFGMLAWKRLRVWRVTNHIHACSVIANRVLFARRTGPRITLLSLTVHILTTVAAWCVARSISVPVSFLNLFILLLPVLLITMLPVSIAGWGVRETAMMVAFGYAGLSQASGVDVSLLFGAVTFIVGAAGGIMWICSSERPAAVLPSTI
ncbi:MAG TPA: lysylphosphatidylglycerol synthase transmembrane domain-containing protein [Ancylobacter sp.]